jgi:hypothetical protein
MGLSDCNGNLGHWSLASLQRLIYFDVVQGGGGFRWLGGQRQNGAAKGDGVGSLFIS